MKFKALQQCRVAHPTDASIPQVVFKAGIEYDTDAFPEWAIERMGKLGYLVAADADPDAIEQQKADMEMEERARVKEEERIAKEQEADVAANRALIDQGQANPVVSTPTKKKGKGKG